MSTENNQEIIVIPEIMKVESINGLAVSTQKAILEAFAPFVQQFDEWYEKAQSIQVTDVSQVDLMKSAREARLALVKVRTGADKVRKELKEETNRYNKAVQEIYNKIEVKISLIEEHLEKQEKFKEIIEAEERAKKVAERMDRCKEFPLVTSEMIINLSDEMFETFLNGLVTEKQRKEEEERKRIEEEERIKAIQVLNNDRRTELMSDGLWQFASEESKQVNFGEYSINDFQVFKNLLMKLKADHELEQERIKQENERLKKEAEEKAKEIERINSLRMYRSNELANFNYIHHSDLADLAEDEFNSLLETQKSIHQAKELERLEQERIAKEKAEQERLEREKVEAERKRLADELAEKERIEKERIAEEQRIEAERIAEEKRKTAAPDKEKVINAIDGLQLPSLDFNDANIGATYTVIESKFNAFKTWAKEQINSK